MGTKDNKLIHIDVDAVSSSSTSTTTTPYYQVIPRPPAPPHPFETIDPTWPPSGIHCLDLSPSGDLLATGGTNTSDCVVMRTSDWSPVTTLVGHRDWLFGCCWVTDRHLVTGSRDRSVALWSIGGSDGEEIGYEYGSAPTVQEYDYLNHSQMKRKYEGKVRDLKWNKELGYVAGLGTEGVVKLHDPAVDLRVVRSLKIPHAKELVSMALRQDLVAVGGLSFISLSDPRKRDPGALITCLTSPDISQGVRSVCIQGDVVSFGTGRGKIVFYDLRAGKCLPTMIPSITMNAFGLNVPGGGSGNKGGAGAATTGGNYLFVPGRCIHPLILGDRRLSRDEVSSLFIDEDEDNSDEDEDVNVHALVQEEEEEGEEGGEGRRHRGSRGDEEEDEEEGEDDASPVPPPEPLRLDEYNVRRNPVQVLQDLTRMIQQRVTSDPISWATAATAATAAVEELRTHHPLSLILTTTTPGRYRQLAQTLGVHPPPPQWHWLQSGPGWIREDSTFWEYFGGRRTTHACYAHAWDPLGARLFTCGGPLAFGLSGGYLAVWE